MSNDRGVGRWAKKGPGVSPMALISPLDLRAVQAGIMGRSRPKFRIDIGAQMNYL
jgi:hypothetical protein